MNEKFAKLTVKIQKFMRIVQYELLTLTDAPT